MYQYFFVNKFISYYLCFSKQCNYYLILQPTQQLNNNSLWTIYKLKFKNDSLWKKKPQQLLKDELKKVHKGKEVILTSWKLEVKFPWKVLVTQSFGSHYNTALINKYKSIIWYLIHHTLQNSSTAVTWWLLREIFNCPFLDLSKPCREMINSNNTTNKMVNNWRKCKSSNEPP